MMLGDAHRMIAILRGITVPEVPEAMAILLAAGFRAIEIPLNSPDAMHSIEQAVASANGYAANTPDAGPILIGGGTVLEVRSVRAIARAGGRLVVAPNCNADVIKAGLDAGCVTIPGVFTATEAFEGLNAGAHGLKLFPASTMGPEGVKALKAVLPPETKLIAVGGVDQSNFATYFSNGVWGFGIGSALYQPAMPMTELHHRAQTMTQALNVIDR